MLSIVTSTDRLLPSFDGNSNLVHAVNLGELKMHIYKEVRLIPHSYELAPGQWRSHIFMQVEDESEQPVEAVAALRLFDSEVEANAMALSWARTLVARGTWCNGRHLSSSMDRLPEELLAAIDH